MREMFRDMLKHHFPLSHAYEALPGFFLSASFFRIFPKEHWFWAVAIVSMLVGFLWSIVIYIKNRKDSNNDNLWVPAGVILSGTVYGILGLLSAGTALYLIALGGILAAISIGSSSKQE